MLIDFRVRPPFKGFEKIKILGEKKGYELYPWNFPDTEPVVSAKSFSLPLFMKEMAECGIDKAVVMPRLTPGGAGGVSNEEVVAGTSQHPDVFVPYASVDTSGGIHAAVRELEHAVKDLGCRGVTLEPGSFLPPMQADAAALYPIYDRCEELNIPVVLTMSMKQGPLISLADPACVQKAARDFPKVQFVIAHAAYPFVLHAAAVACVTPNVWLLPDVYMNISDIPGSKDFAQAVHLLHGQRILYGSAYPLRGLKQSLEALAQYEFPKNYYDMLTYKNAEILLNN